MIRADKGSLRANNLQDTSATIRSWNRQPAALSRMPLATPPFLHTRTLALQLTPRLFARVCPRTCATVLACSLLQAFKAGGTRRGAVVRASRMDLRHV
eukprot:1079688-Rhodomonas_salina.2